MKMKTTFFFVLAVLIISVVSVHSGFAQYAAHTQLGLPEGAKARLGKGRIYDCTAIGNSGHSLNQDCDRIQSY